MIQNVYDWGLCYFVSKVTYIKGRQKLLFHRYTFNDHNDHNVNKITKNNNFDSEPVKAFLVSRVCCRVVKLEAKYRLDVADVNSVKASNGKVVT